jgi:hypothetical protein
MTEGKLARTDVIQTQAVTVANGKRFCLEHHAQVTADQGCIVRRGRSTRWVCFTCQARREAALALQSVNEKTT